MSGTETGESGKRNLLMNIYGAFMFDSEEYEFLFSFSESMSPSAYVARRRNLPAHEMLSRSRHSFKWCEFQSWNFLVLKKKRFLTRKLLSLKIVNFKWKWETNECYMPLPMPSYGCSNQCNIGMDQYVRQERFSAASDPIFGPKLTISPKPSKVPSFQRT